MPDRLPVIVVDDDLGQLAGAVTLLELEDWSVTGISDLDEAARVLVDHTDPFVLILDHDFERPDGQTGLDLTRLLRAAHPWGAVLPICYWSGRIDGSAFLQALRDGQMFAPSSYVQKGGSVSVADVAQQADESFRRFQATFEQQSLRRAVLNLGTALPVDDELTDPLDDDALDDDALDDDALDDDALDDDALDDDALDDDALDDDALDDDALDDDALDDDALDDDVVTGEGDR